jgi:methionyl-tRNA formyltransferase
MASGNLGLSVIKSCKDDILISFIATDSNSVEIIEFAKDNNIPLFIGNPRMGKLANFISQFGLDVLLSVNYLFLVEEDVISMVKYPINFHGSLLPKYRGRTPHVWAIINNESQTGVTAHIIDNGCDTGPIVLQKTIEINAQDTGADILNKFALLYPVMIREILGNIRSDTLTLTPQDDSLATYFGKRVPEDGKIDWNWQKERIRNWTRALAYPYPGAFTYLNEKKIIIDSIAYSDFGFIDEDKNGFVLKKDSQIIVKTQNGAVILEEIRENKEIIEVKSILGT